MPGRLLPWIPLLLAGGYALWLVGSYRRIISVVHINPDAAWAPVLVRGLGTPGNRGGSIFVGEASHLTTIWFLALTRELPFRDVIWDWAPFAFFLGGLGLTGWAAHRVAGQWPTALTVALGLASGATILLTVFAEGIRGHTFVADAFLAAVLVWAATGRLDRPGRSTASRGNRRPGQLAGVGVLVLLVAGATLASDPLFLAVGLVPFAAAPVVVGLIDRTRASRDLALAGPALAAVAFGLSELVWRAMGSVGFEKNYLKDGYAFASPSQIRANLEEFVVHLLSLTNGFFADQQGPMRLGRLAMALVLAGTVVYCSVLFFRTAKAVRAGSGERGLLMYLAFWLLSAGGTFAAFALSTFPAGPSDSSRYVIPAVFALGAVAPLAARFPGRCRLAAAGAVALFCLLSIASRQELFAYERVPGFKTLLDEGPRIAQFVRSEGIHRGYSGYFTSHQLSLMSGMSVQVYPVIACHQPESDVLCPFSVNVRTSWFEPQQGRSFFLHDASAPEFIAPAPPASFGDPVTQQSFGSITAYVYDYDVAELFDRPCRGSATFVCPS
ncbi:MAG: hypothetical protein ACT4OM_05885 [Actinomycetota bacterium]